MMQNVIKTTIIALVAVMIGSQAIATPLKKQKSEDSKITITGIARGTVKEAAKDVSKTLDSEYEVVVEGKDKQEIAYVTGKKSRTLKNAIKVLKKGQIVTFKYKQPTIIGDLANHKLPKIPGLENNHLEITQVLTKDTDFSKSDSKGFKDKLIQDNSVGTTYAYEVQGNIVSVERNSGTTYLFPATETTRTCTVSLVHAEGVNKYLTQTEEMCKFAENALTSGNAVRLYHTRTVLHGMLKTPSIIALKLASAESDAKAIGHDGKSVVAALQVDNSESGYLTPFYAVGEALTGYAGAVKTSAANNISAVTGLVSSAYNAVTSAPRAALNTATTTVSNTANVVAHPIQSVTDLKDTAVSGSVTVVENIRDLLSPADSKSDNNRPTSGGQAPAKKEEVKQKPSKPKSTKPKLPILKRY